MYLPPTTRRKLRTSAGVVALVPLAAVGLDSGLVASILIVGFLVLSLSVHEFAHAGAAYLCGDTTARDEGRLTLNPIAHIDLMWTIVMPGLCLLAGVPPIGGAKPVPINPRNLRNPMRDLTFAALAGPVSNLLLAVLFFALYKFFVQTGYYTGASEMRLDRPEDLLPHVLYWSSLTNVALFVFNMIPIPPLDGSRVMEHLLPASARASYMALGGYGIIITYLLLRFVPVVSNAYFDSIMYLFRAVQRISSMGGAW